MEPRIEHTVLDRFLRYVTYDTQSKMNADTYPSTAKQKVLARALVDELEEIGLADAALDEYGYVMATLPATTAKPVPVVGLIAHMDTSPDVSGANVKPVVHRNYAGGDIVLPGDPSQVIRPADNPDLANQIGHDLVTSDGTTLLGADDKAGIAEIFDALQHLARHPEIEHGPIRVAITPDEEVGEGTRHFDLEKFGADCAYTLDGSDAGEIEDETFCADTLVLRVRGVNMHPGFAKDRMTNSLKVACEIVDRLPRETLSPETTAGREGYIHPTSIKGNVESTTVTLLLRDFSAEGLRDQEAQVRAIAAEALANRPQARVAIEVAESYRNMKLKLDGDPRVVDYAMEAVRRTGLAPKQGSIRGGTDGARLSYMGLLTPNIFTGGHAFHSEREWVAVQDMHKAVETIVHLVHIWFEKS